MSNEAAHHVEQYNWEIEMNFRISIERDAIPVESIESSEYSWVYFQIKWLLNKGSIFSPAVGKNNWIIAWTKESSTEESVEW